MRLALIIVLTASGLAFLLYFLTIESGPQQAVDMPWQVTVLDERHSQVFGVVLNRTTLEQARQHFGQLDGIALFQDQAGAYSLEAYFGKVAIGPFSARIIATLDASADELQALVEHSVKRVLTEDGSYKWSLTQDKQAAQAGRRIKSLAFIPGYRGMDQVYVEQRFGEPARRDSVDETAELWYYPEQGIRILVDNDGRELFEYLAPADFQQIYGAN